MLDRERADFYRTLAALQEQLSDRCVAIELPIGSEHELTGIVDLLHNCAYLDPGGSREGEPDSVVLVLPVEPRSRDPWPRPDPARRP